MSLKPAIKASFGRRVLSYETASNIQARVASRLGELLPVVERPDVLELGCGTGLFTRVALTRYPDGRFLVSDLSRDMVGACSDAIGAVEHCTFKVIDADTLMEVRRYDVVASSMALHWCDDPVSSLERQRACLKPGGKVVFATIGDNNFPEWRQVLEDLGFDSGARLAPELAGVVSRERVTIDYGSARGFFDALKKTGAAVARPGYRPLGRSEFKRACALLDERYCGRVSWDIVYGVLEATTHDATEPIREAVPVRV